MKENDGLAASIARSFSNAPVPLQLTEDVLSRRLFFIVACLFGTCVHLIFFFSNITRQIVAEAVLDLSVALLFLAALVVVRRVRTDSGLRNLYRVGIAIAAFSPTNAVFFEQHPLGYSLLGLYFLPPLIFYLLGIKDGIRCLLVLPVAVSVICCFPAIVGREVLPVSFFLRFVGSILLLVALAAVMEWSRGRFWDLLFRADKRLHKAMEDLKVIEGLIPICAYCKKIRYDDGFWQNLESYLATHSSAQISTGFCPKCSEEHSIPPPKLPQSTADIASELSEISAKAAASKQQAAMAFLGIALFLLWIFAMVAVLQGKWSLLPMETAAGLVTVGCSFFLKKRRFVTAIYNVFIASLTAVVFQQFLFEDAGGANMLWLYAIPVAAIFLVGYRQGFIWIGVTAVLLVMVYTGTGFRDPVPGNLEFKLGLAVFFLILTVLTMIMERSKTRYAAEVMNRIEQLQQTYLSIRTLKGMIPVCSSCKSIRNDKGFWTSLEEYMMEHTDLKMSHCICPSCLKVNFPDIYEEMLAKGLITPDTISETARNILSTLPKSQFCEVPPKRR